MLGMEWNVKNKAEYAGRSSSLYLSASVCNCESNLITKDQNDRERERMIKKGSCPCAAVIFVTALVRFSIHTIWLLHRDWRVPWQA